MARTASRPAGSRAGLFVFTAALLAAPAAAALDPAFPLTIEVSASLAAALSLAAYLAHAFDKRRAETGAPRVPELVLHGMEVCGGWPGALLAQRIHRHKTAKASYQLAFWLIIAVHEYLAADFLLGWKLARTVAG